MNHKIQTHTCTFCSKYLCCVHYISIWTISLFICTTALLGKYSWSRFNTGLRKLKLSSPPPPPAPMPNAERFASHSMLQNRKWDFLKHTWELGILLVFHRQRLRHFFCTAALLQQKRWRMFPPKISSSQEIKWLLRGGKWEAEFPQEEKETKSVFHTSWQEPSPLDYCIKGACPLSVL